MGDVKQPTVQGRAPEALVAPPETRECYYLQALRIGLAAASPSIVVAQKIVPNPSLSPPRPSVQYRETPKETL